MTTVLRKVLPNGVRILAEPITSVRSASIGLFLEIGSRHERPSEAGLCHFIEHMFFKGTSRMSASDLAREMDLLGGNINAYTTHETLCLHAKVVDDCLPKALDLLAEMLLDSVFDADEVDRERNVVLEEIRMYEDAPDEVVVDRFMEALYGSHVLGRPVLGLPERVSAFRPADIRRFLAREFVASRLIVAVAGNHDPRELTRQATRLFGAMPCAAAPIPAAGLKPPRPRPGVLCEARPLEQAHFCVGVPCPHRASPDRFAFSVMSMALGGGSSSRIFQEVREKRGLAYSIGTAEFPFRDVGCFSIGGGTGPKTLAEVLRLCTGEVRRMCDETLPEDEIDCARQQILSSILLGLENTASRMNRLAEYEVYHHRQIPVDRVIAAVRSVTPAAARKMAQTYLQGRPAAVAAIGPAKAVGAIGDGISF